MSTKIINIPDSLIPEAISFGWDLRLKETFAAGEEMSFRMKLGAILSDVATGEVLSRVEVDAFGEGVEYTIDVGGIIKQYITAEEPLYIGGLIGYMNKSIKIEPYRKTRTLEGSWVTTTYASASKTFVMQRGIDSNYYRNWIEGLNIGDYELFTDGKDTHITMPFQGKKWLYQQMVEEDYAYNTFQITSTYTVQASDGSTTDIPGADGPEIDSRGTNDYFYAVPLHVLTGSIYGTIIKQHLTCTTRTKVKAGDVLVTTYIKEIYVDYDCKDNRDFKFDLAFLDQGLLWRTIPFYMNNDLTAKRNKVSILGYDKRKRDILLDARLTYSAKSDYLSKEDAASYMYYGISPEYLLIRPGELALFTLDAVLVGDTTPIKSPNNEGLIQIEATVEQADVLKLV